MLNSRTDSSQEGALNEKFGIPLFALPPARPKYNGGVERSNRTYLEEFYGDKRMQETSLMRIRRELKNIRKNITTNDLAQA